MDEQTTTTQEAEQTAPATATETQEQQKAEDTPEKVSALQKFINGLFGGKESDATGSDEEEGEEAAADGASSEKNFTQADMDAAIEAAKNKWADEAVEAERVKKLSPEEKAAEEQKKRDTEIADLRGQLLKKELQETATKALEKDGFPVRLAGMLNYSSKEAMEESLKETTEMFKESLEVAIKARLKGKTPEGLGGAASPENLIRSQIAKNIRGI